MSVAKDRALFLKERAFEMVSRQGTVERNYNAGVGRSYASSGFTIWYSDPETADTDECHHFYIRSGGRKVFSAVWGAGESAQIVTFRRGPWEEYFLA